MADPYYAHTRLFSDKGLKLGRVLWYLLDAAQSMGKRMYATHTTDDGHLARSLTDFGQEVGKDEIHWWVYKKETNLGELHTRVNQVLESVQLLKEASSRLDPFGIKTYQDLADHLAGFLELQQSPIDELCQFVVWLHAKDPLAPSILFSYRVWGDSRRGARWLELDSPSIDGESDQIIRTLTEIACGLLLRGTYTRFHEMMEIGAEQYDSDPENPGSQDIPEPTLVSRTARKALTEFSVFFQELRDSLRNVALDIEKYQAERDLLRSESFWKAFIAKAKALGRVEPEVWDFKESLPMWHGGGVKAQVDFCKDVAAFANKRGGAIIIGVSDGSREIVGVQRLESRMKAISEAMRRYLDYPKRDAIVHLHPVLFEGGKFPCLVVAVAQASEVVGVRGVSGEYYYPDRDQTGTAYRERRELENRKMHLKAGDNFGFMRELETFVYDR